MTALPKFVGTVAPADLLSKLDQQAAELEARKAAGDAARTSTDARLASIERTVRPPGAIVGSQPAAFLASSVSPVAMTARGYVNLPASLGLDQDGKNALVRLTEARFAIVALETTVNPGTSNPYLRATVYDVGANGIPVQLATTLFGVNTASNVNTATVILGGARVADNVCRFATTFGPTGTISHAAVYTLTFDPVTNGIAISTDNAGAAGSISGPYPYGSLHRRRGHIVGASGLFVPAMQGGLHFGTRSVLLCPGGFLFDRTPGSSSVLPRMLAGISQTYPFALDRVTDNLFVVMSDGYTAGLGASAILSLVLLDDVHAGPISTLRFGVGMSGNARVTALSATLFVVGFSSGAQFATYLVERNPATNALRIVGSAVIAGDLGLAPIEVVRLGPAKFLTFVKGGNWQLFGTVYDADMNAGTGASPFVQAAKFSANLGQAMPGATITDAYTVGTIEPLTGDRIAVTYRNANRTLCGVEILDLS